MDDGSIQGTRSLWFGNEGTQARCLLPCATCPVAVAVQPPCLVSLPASLSERRMALVYRLRGQRVDPKGGAREHATPCDRLRHFNLHWPSYRHGVREQ